MARYAGGTQVSRGHYWGPGQWHLTSIDRDGQVLPGSASRRYLRVSWPAALLAGPLLAALFVLFLPFMALAMLFEWMFLKSVREARPGAAGPSRGRGGALLEGGAAGPPEEDVRSGGAGEEALSHVAREVSRRRLEAAGRGD